MAFTPAQCRAARALLDWPQAKLAEQSRVATKTIADFERGARVPYDRTLIDIQSALESAGVIFVAENGEGPGVRLRKKQETAADLTHKIDTIEADIQKTKGSSAKTPEGGMRTLERAHKREAVKKLKNRRTKLGKTKK